jgi:hypothetical protein
MMTSRRSRQHKVKDLSFMAAYVYTVAVRTAHSTDNLARKTVVMLVFSKRYGRVLEDAF